MTRKEAREYIIKHCNPHRDTGTKWNDAMECAIKALGEPERKKGRWIYNENGIDWNLPAWTCSECHCRNDNIPTVIKFGNKCERIADPRSWLGSRFCPSCGADMRGKEE